VGTSQHRLIGVLVGQASDGVDQPIQLRQQRLRARLAQHQSVGEIVDVLGRAGEVDEFANRLQFGVAGDFLLEQVFDRLHVMVGGAFDVLDPLGVGETEFLDQPIENVHSMLAQGRHFGDAGMASQRLQPAYLYQHPMANQAVLAENRPQIGSFIAVAAVDGRNGGQCGEFHGIPPADEVALF